MGEFSLLTPILLKKFSKKTGLSEASIRKKLSRGVWKYGEGGQCVKDPDGKIHVIWERYVEWVDASLVQNTPAPINGVSNGCKKKVPKRRTKGKLNPYKV